MNLCQTTASQVRSRAIHSPLPLHHRCCDYAQHDGVCRATLSLITHALPPSFRSPPVIPAVSAEPKLPGVSAEPKLSGVSAEPKLPGVTAEPKLRHSARSRGIHDPLPLHHRCCDYAQHDGVCSATPSPITHALPPSFPAPAVIPAVSAEPKLPGVSAEPKLRHSARSRGIHGPLPPHHRCCDYAQHDDACSATPSPITHALPPSFPAPPVIPGVSAEPKLPGVSAEPKLRHSARSRGIHGPLPPHHRCCDYAQHDGVCRATPSPITHALPPSFRAPPVIPAVSAEPKLPGVSAEPKLSGVSAEPKLRHSARSRGIHDPLPLHHRCCDYAQHDGVCSATPSLITHALPPSFPAPPVIPAVSAEPKLPGVTAEPKLPGVTAEPKLPGVTAEPKLRHSARSRGIHDPLPPHHRCCDYAQHDGVCSATPSPITHALLPSFPAPAVIPAVSAEPKLPGVSAEPKLPGVTAEPKLRHSARSRGIHDPLPPHHRCCDYAQHDGVCRATLSPITHALPPSFPAPPVIPAVSAEPKLPGVTAEPKLRHSARSRGIHDPLPPQHGCCDYAQHDGVCRATLSPITHALPPSFRAPPVIPAVSAEPKLPGVSAEPKLRHSARSRGIHDPLPLHHRCCDYAQHDGVCRATPSPITHALPPSFPAPPVISAVSAEPKLRHSARSRGIHGPLPPHHRCCDYAQHDGVCRATLSLISHALPPSFPAPAVIPAVTAEPKLPEVRAEPKLRHSARSRGIHDPLPPHHRCCDYAQHDGVCSATPSPITHALLPSFPAPAVIPAVSAEPKLPGVTAEPKLPGVSAEPKLRHSARSRGIHDPLPPHHRCCDYAQHDGVCRATLSLISHALPPSLRNQPRNLCRIRSLCKK